MERTTAHPCLAKTPPPPSVRVRARSRRAGTQPLSSPARRWTSTDEIRAPPLPCVPPLRPPRAGKLRAAARAGGRNRNRARAPVGHVVVPGGSSAYAAPPPTSLCCVEPDAFAAALRDVRDLILPGMTHWQSPRHFAHFPTSSSTVGALREALAAGINAVPFTWAVSPAATELEMVVVDRLGKALHLPEALLFCCGGGGMLLGTSCEAILCALVAARERKLVEIGSKRNGDLVVYCSDQTHFAFRMAARIAGIHRDNCRVVATYRDDMFALSPVELRAAMQADVDVGLVPLFLCATIGTTQTTAVDPVRELCAVAAGVRLRDGRG